MTTELLGKRGLPIVAANIGFLPHPTSHLRCPVMIDAYHALLTPDIAESSHEHLDSMLRKRGLVFATVHCAPSSARVS
jgi:hypothetical protein